MAYLATSLMAAQLMEWSPMFAIRNISYNAKGVCLLVHHLKHKKQQAQVESVPQHTSSSFVIDELMAIVLEPIADSNVECW